MGFDGVGKLFTGLVRSARDAQSANRALQAQSPFADPRITLGRLSQPVSRDPSVGRTLSTLSGSVAQLHSTSRGASLEGYSRALRQAANPNR